MAQDWKTFEEAQSKLEKGKINPQSHEEIGEIRIRKNANNFEKSLALQEKVKDLFNEAQKKLTFWEYDSLKDWIKEAEEAGVYVNNIKAQMPELLKKIIIHYFEYIKKDLSLLSYDVFANRLKKYEEAGIDVANIKAQMPELLKKVLQNEIKNHFEESEDYPSWNDYGSLLNLLEKAEEAGINVDEFEKTLPKLYKIAIRREIKNLLIRDKRGDIRALDFIPPYLEKAKKAGIDVAKIKAQMLKLPKEGTQNEIEYYFEEAEDYPWWNSYQTLLMHLEKAEKVGINVNEFKEHLPRLYKIAIRREMKDIIVRYKWNPSAEVLKSFNDFVRKAKEIGIDVSTLEARMEKLRE
jgi:hypothetical protein